MHAQRPSLVWNRRWCGGEAEEVAAEVERTLLEAGQIAGPHDAIGRLQLLLRHLVGGRDLHKQLLLKLLADFERPVAVNEVSHQELHLNLLLPFLLEEGRQSMACLRLFLER